MADIDLPVFSFRPNRREAMSERLSFLTDVLRADQGAEQRRSLRETPRRTFEADFLLVGPERTFWDLFMNRLGGSELMAPIYWEVVSLASGLTAGVSDRIDFDTAHTEWPYFEGGLALVAGDSALRWEVVQIAAVDSGGIDLVDPVTVAWPTGAKLYPLRRAVVEEFGDLTQPSAAVGKVTARLRFVTANPWTPATEPAPIYGGLPVLLTEPNWADDLSASFERDIAVLDTNVGLTYQVDALSRFFVGQAHRYFLPGREQMALFRDLLYRYRGRAGSFWLPTFKADFKLAASVLSGSNQLVVENVGFQYAGGPTGGREYIVIRHSTGTIFRKIVDVIPGTTSATEKLVLDSPVGLALSPGLVRKISFMDTARFDSDEFEIAHHSGADGLHECSTAFRTFKNTRSSPTPIHYPHPAGVMNSDPCGEAPSFYAMFRVEWLSASTPQPSNGFFLAPEVGQTLFHTANNTAVNHVVVEPFEYIEFVYLINDIPTGQEVNLQLQFGYGSVSDAMRARAKILRYGDSDYTVLYPKAGSHSLADGSGWFDIRSLWPDDWLFDI